MPYVRGFLRVGRRHRPGRPTDPDYGIEEGERPEISPPDEGEDGDLEVGGGPVVPSPPPGVWPPIRPEEGWRPVDPGYGQGRPRPPHVGGGPAPEPPAPGRPDQGLPRPERPVDPGWGIEEGPPPGTIWPPLPEGVDGKFWVLALVGGMPGGPKYRYVCIDASLRPGNRPPGTRPPRPDQGLPPGSGHPDQGLPPTAGPRTG